MKRWRDKRTAADPGFRLRALQGCRERYVKRRLAAGKTPAYREPLASERGPIDTLLAAIRRSASGALRRLLLIRLFQQAPRCRVGRGPAAVSEESASVSGGVCDRGGLPEVPGCLSLARRVPLSSVWASAGLHSRAETTVAVRGVSTPGLVDVGNGAPQYEDPADGLVLGCVPDDN